MNKVWHLSKWCQQAVEADKIAYLFGQQIELLKYPDSCKQHSHSGL